MKKLKICKYCGKGYTPESDNAYIHECDKPSSGIMKQIWLASAFDCESWAITPAGKQWIDILNGTILKAEETISFISPFNMLVEEKQVIIKLDQDDIVRAVAKYVRDELKQALGSGSYEPVHIDNVTFIDSKTVEVFLPLKDTGESE